MRFVQHRTNNKVLGAPEQWDQAKLVCNALPVTVDELAPGVKCIHSFWAPNAQELSELNRGGLVRLTVLGETTKPVALAVVAP